MAAIRFCVVCVAGCGICLHALVLMFAVSVSCYDAVGAIAWCYR